MQAHGFRFEGDRGLVTAADRIGNLDQLRALIAGGYAGPVSFQPFAAPVQSLADPAPAIRRSMDLDREGTSIATA